MKNKILVLILILIVFIVGIVVLRGPKPSKVATVTTVTLPAKGALCADCEETLEQALLALPGVLEVVASLSDETVTITYDKDKIIIQALVETLQKRGYASRVPTANQLEVLDFQIKFNE
jgi:copper chaperone CopZ